MHRPWEHSEEIRHLFVDGRITDNSLSVRLKDAYNYAYECEEIANDRNICYQKTNMHRFRKIVM